MTEPLLSNDANVAHPNAMARLLNIEQPYFVVAPSVGYVSVEPMKKKGM
jgi:hypothetical protein